MGFEGLKERFLAWMQARWTTFPEFADSFATDLSQNVATLRVGATQDLGGGVMAPPTDGEVAGEIYVSNDLTPPQQAWIWDGAAWIRIG